jgi:hypothetical protein
MAVRRSAPPLSVISVKVELRDKPVRADAQFAKRLQGLRTIPLGVALSVGSDQQPVVSIDGLWQSKQDLEQSLDVGRSEEVAATDHRRDLLEGVVHDHGEVVGYAYVPAGQDNIPRRVGLGDLAPRLSRRSRPGL